MYTRTHKCAAWGGEGWHDSVKWTANILLNFISVEYCVLPYKVPSIKSAKIKECPLKWMKIRAQCEWCMRSFDIVRKMRKIFTHKKIPKTTENEEKKCEKKNKWTNR